jgi:hypothetical protein
MRKSILFSLLCLIAVVAVACGGGTGNNTTTGGNNTGGACGGNGGDKAAAADPAAQWDALYKEGASWTYKMAGGMLQKTEVVSVADGVAKLKQSMKMGEADWMAPTDGEAKRPTGEAAAPAEGYKELGKGSEKVGDWDTDWVEYEMNGKKGKSWTSTKYGCIVKSEYDGAVSMELVELNAK